MPNPDFEKKYPNIVRWVNDHRGWIEVGNSPDGPLTSFIRALDMGGLMWEGDDDYASLDDALLDLEIGVRQCLDELYGE